MCIEKKRAYLIYTHVIATCFVRHELGDQNKTQHEVMVIPFSIVATLSWFSSPRPEGQGNLEYHRYSNDTTQQNSPARDLPRRILPLYYERLLTSKKKQPFIALFCAFSIFFLLYFAVFSLQIYCSEPVIPNPIIIYSFMLVKMNASFVIDFAIRTTSYCNQCLAFIHFSYA